MINFKELTDYEFNKDGSIISHKNNTDHIIKPYITNSGYYQVELLTTAHKKQKYYVHRLIKEYFDPIASMDLFDCDHINKDRLDNSLDNLQWLTHQENIDKDQSKMVGQFLLDGTLIKTYNSIHDAARQTGIDRSLISRCCNNKTKKSHGYIWKFI